MTDLSGPPFTDIPIDTDSQKHTSAGATVWTLPWFEWLRSITSRINERPIITGTVVEGNTVIVDPETGDFIDSGTSASRAGLLSVNTASGQYITENLLHEAGTEPPPIAYKQPVLTHRVDTTFVYDDFFKVHWVESIGTRNVYLPSVGRKDIGVWILIGRKGPGNLRIHPADSDTISNCTVGGWVECTESCRADSILSLRLDFHNKWVFGKGCFGVWSTK